MSVCSSNIAQKILQLEQILKVHPALGCTEIVGFFSFKVSGQKICAAERTKTIS